MTVEWNGLLHAESVLGECLAHTGFAVQIPVDDGEYPIGRIRIVLVAAADPRPASAADIAAALRNERIVRLYPEEGGDWKCRIEKRTRMY